MGTATNNTYKWKPYHTIDVVIDSRGNLYSNNNNSNKLVKLTKTDGYPYVYISNKLEFKDTDVLECDIIFNNKIFEVHPIRKRFDKTTPNNLKTIESTCQSVQHYVTIEDVVDQFIDAMDVCKQCE